MRNILLVEDEENLSNAIKLNLELEGFSVDVVDDGGEAFSAFANKEYTLVILDVMLPNLSGFDICEQIRKVSQIPILFLSAKNTGPDRIKGLRLGADDYLTKPFNLEELLLRVKILTQRRAKQNDSPNDKFIFADFWIDFKSFTLKGLNGEEKISKREAELLKLLIDKKNEVVSRDLILDEIWGKEAFPSTRTIDNYILNFRKHFEKDPKNPSFFHSVRGVGYKFTELK